MRPHLLAFDGPHHSRTEHLQLEIWILQGKRRSCQSTRHKYRYSQQAIAQVSAHNLWILVSKKPKNQRGTRAMAGINDIVGARHHLVEIARKMDGTGVLPDGS